MCQLSCVAHVAVLQKNLQRRLEPRDLSAATARPQKRAKSLQETLPPRRQETIVQTEQQAKGTGPPLIFFVLFWGGSWAQHSANQGTEMRDKLLPKTCNQSGEETSVQTK